MYHYDRIRGLIVFTVITSVKAGEELLITYGKDPEGLYEHYGFCCTCGACAGFTDEDIKDLIARRWL